MLQRFSIYFLLPGALFNIFVPSTCVEHSDWSYDRDNDTINQMSANGTVTFSCTKTALLKARRLSCKNCSQYLSKDENMVMEILTSAMLASDNDTCDPAVPTREQTFERIENIYESAINGSLASKSWLRNISCNIANEIRTMNKTNAVVKNEVGKALWNAFVAYNLTKGELHDVRLEITELEAELLYWETSVKENEETLMSFKTITDRIDGLQEELPQLEMLAVSDSAEFAPSTWTHVADTRNMIMNNVLLEMRMKDRIIRTQQVAALTRMELVAKKAEANAKVAVIEQLMNEVTYHMEQARLADLADEDGMYF